MFACAVSYAQTTTVTASALKMGGIPIASGTVSIVPQNAQNVAIPFSGGDGSMNGPQGFTAAITNGALPAGFTVPDQALASGVTANTPVFYQVTVTNTANKQAYGFSLPPGTVKGATFALDLYRAAQTAAVLTTVTANTALPSSLKCAGAAEFLLYSGTTITADYKCLNGTLSPLALGSGSGAPPTLAIGTVTQGAAAATITGSNGAYTLNLVLPQGIEGTNGTSPTLTVGNVTTGAAGSAATVALRANGSVGYFIDFSIPQGTAATGSALALKVNGTANSSQTVLNLVAGSGITLSDNGSGTIALSVIPPQAYLFTNFPVSGMQPGQIIYQTDWANGTTCTQGSGTARSDSAWRQCRYVSTTNGVATYATADAVLAEKSTAAKPNPNGVIGADGNGLVDPALLYAATPTTAGVQTTAAVTAAQQAATAAQNAAITAQQTANTALARVALKPTASTNCFGTSYVYGTGATTPLVTGICGLVSRDTPGPNNNYGLPGQTSAPISNSIYGNFVRDSVVPSVSLLDGGENDGAQTSAASQTGVKNMLYSHIAWLTIPAQYRVLASAATASGTWVTDFNLPAAANLNSPGAGLRSTTSASALSFAVPSTNTGNKVGVTYYAASSGTGTFTVAIDGALQTDNCSGTTTFTAAPCGSFYATEQRQEFTVSANAPHTVVVTTTNSGSVAVASVDWLPPATSSTGTLGASNENVVFANTLTTNFGSAATFNPIIRAAVAALGVAGEGLPVYLTDLELGTGSARAINNSSDMSTTQTATCPASTTGGHLNDCGHQDWLANLNQAESLGGYVFSNQGAGGKFTYQTGTIATYLNAQPSCSSFDSCMNRMGQNIVGAGFYGYNAANKIGYRTDQFVATGKPYNGAFGQEFYDTLGGWLAVAQYFGSSTTGGSAVTPHWAVKTTTGSTAKDGYDLSQVGAAVASAATITPTGAMFHVTGTTAISTINLPTDASSAFGTCIDMIADGAASTATGGNIASAITFTVGSPYRACYVGSLWYIK